jgi:hypothetical protein
MALLKVAQNVNATSDSVKDNFDPFMPALLCQQKTAFIKKTSLLSKCTAYQKLS